MSQPSRRPDDLLSRSISPDELPDPRASLELLSMAQGGDRQALEELVDRYQGRLRRIVRIQLGGSVVRRHFDSMDIVQETFRAALPRLSELRPRSAASLLQWLAIIATNRICDAHDYVRAGKRDVGRETPLDRGGSAGASASGGRSGPPADMRSPSEEAALAEVRELLDDEVARLSEDQRRVVLLRDYCGEGWEHIAAELNRENGAARELHQRAWIRLRKALRPKLEGWS